MSIGRARADRESASAHGPSARRRRPSASRFAAAMLLVLAALAGSASLTAVALQLLARGASSPPPGVVRVRLPLPLPLPLPLRPSLPAEGPPWAPEVAAPPDAPGDRPSGSPPARAENYAALSQAIGRGDPAALARARALAEAGAPMPQLLLAKLYEAGDAGLPRDLTLARRWTERAAEAGERAAMHNLAIYLMKGEGGPPDAPAAARWFSKAAESGVVDAQYNLGLLYENGRGVAKNLVEAYRWYSIAANAGDGLARGRAVALEGRLTRKELAVAADEASGFQPGGPPPVAVPVIPPAATVAESQKLLAREGRFIGATDGADTPAYRAAVAGYLQDHPQARTAGATP